MGVARSMISVFLGAGFSAVGGVPLASQLFDRRPQADIISRQNLIERVLDGWDRWYSQTCGTPEQYLAHLESNIGPQWRDAVWYIALAITLETPRVGIRGVVKVYVSHHALSLKSGIDVHESFWTTIFSQTTNVAVLTTNYDILAERELRLRPRSRPPRPGFHYGNGAEQLQGVSPGILRNPRPKIEGAVPLLKLHGSVSWTIRNNGLEHYHDCRPAIRGDAAIIAPVIEKSIPSAFRPIWNNAEAMLGGSNIWIIVGYSFPHYDEAINELFRSNASHRPRVHILDPDPNVVRRVKLILPNSDIHSHDGLPNALHELPAMLV